MLSSLVCKRQGKMRKQINSKPKRKSCKLKLNMHRMLLRLRNNYLKNGINEPKVS
jgi:hypothetical protein